MLLSIQPALVRFGPTLVVIAAITLCYGAALGSPLTLYAMHTDDDVVWQFRTDTIEQFAYVQEHGYLPFWIDRRGLGQSAFVGSYHGNFYPLRWLALRLAPRAEEAADWLIWGHMLVAGLATMALARHYGMSDWAAAFAGIFFALGHLPVRWAPFSHAPIHFATYPLAVLGTELIWSGRGRHGAGLLALSLGISSLGTILYHPHMVFHVVGIIVLYRLLTISVPRRVRLKRLGLSAAAVLLGIAIAVPVLVPFVWEQRGTTREAVVEAGASGMNYFSLTAYVDPRSLQIGDHVYMGPLAPALMLVGLLVSLRRRRLAILPLLVVLGLLIGFKTPLLDLLQQMVPGWSAVSNVRRLSFVTVLPLALMAGLGLDWLRNSRRKGQTTAIVGALVGTSLMFWWLHIAEWGLWRSPALWLGLIATALIAFLLHTSVHRTAATGSASGTGGTRPYRSTFAIIGTLVGTSLMVWLGWWLRVAGLERPALIPVLGLGLVAITLSVYLLYKNSLHRLADDISASLPTLAVLGALVGASVAFCWLRVTELGRLAFIPALWLGAAPGACPPTWGRLGLIPVLWLGVITTAPIAFLLRKTSRHRLAADPHTSLPILVLLGVLVGAGLMVWWLRMAELGLEQGLSPVLWLGLVALALIVATAPIAFLLYKRTPLHAADSSRASLLILALVFGVSLLALGVERQLRWRPVPDQPLPEFVDTLALVARHNDPAGRWMSFSIPMHESYMPNVFLEVPGRWLDTYESFRPPEFFTYWRTLTGSTQYDQRREGLGSLWYMHTDQDPTPNANLVNAAGITRVLGSSDRIAEAEQLGWSLLGDQGILRVYHNPQAFPMAYGSRRWASAAPDAAIARIATAEQGSFDRHTDYVDGVTPVASPGEDPLPARVVRPSAEEVQVTLVAPSRTPALMVLLDSYHPDWQALVDGERRPVLRVNGVFRGVLLEPGETQVIFRFEPRWFPWLPAIAAAVAVATGLLLLPIGLMRRAAQRLVPWVIGAGESRATISSGTRSATIRFQMRERAQFESGRGDQSGESGMASAVGHAGKRTAGDTDNGGLTTPEAHDSARCGVLPARQWPSIRVEPETLPAPGDAVEDLETPVLVVDLDRMEANIQFVQAYCERLGVRNRIHIKTHKIPQIAALQVAAGAAGITVQKLGEAEVFAASGLGFDDIFLPYNILGTAKLRRLRAFLEHYPGIELSLTCDSAVVAEGLSAVAHQTGRRLKVWVECDAGLGRAGVTQPRQALDLAGAIERLAGLTFGGLMSFTADAEPSVAFMTAALAVFRRAGRPAPEVTMGGTRQLRWVEQVPGVTEHRPGTYVFHDRQTVLQGGWSFDDCAGTVRTTVVSRPTAERGILDAGSKAITPETMGLDGLLGHLVEYPEARLYRLSEEHGYADFSAYPESERPQVGDVLAVIPNHICTTVNMFNWLVGARNGRVEVVWPVAARGRVR